MTYFKFSNGYNENLVTSNFRFVEFSLSSPNFRSKRWALSPQNSTITVCGPNTGQKRHERVILALEELP